MNRDDIEFIHYLGEDGVAAYSVGCYLMPIAFMFGNAIVQSSQPIISFAHGAAKQQSSPTTKSYIRIDRAMQINIFTGLLCGICGFLFTWFASSWVSTTFLSPGCHAWQLCNEGLFIDFMNGITGIHFFFNNREFIIFRYSSTIL